MQNRWEQLEYATTANRSEGAQCAVQESFCGVNFGNPLKEAKLSASRKLLAVILVKRFFASPFILFR